LDRLQLKVIKVQETSEEIITRPLPHKKRVLPNLSGLLWVLSFSLTGREPGKDTPTLVDIID